MFTKEIYSGYFTEIHNKEKDLIILLNGILKQTSDDYTRKAVTWHMKREIRLAVLVRKLVRSLAADNPTEPESPSAKSRLKYPFEVIGEGRF
jgi:hypothetical protein